jgi:hypothetical protein
MVRLAIDFEFPSRVWWESGGQELWEALCDSPDGGGVVVDDDLATSWIAQAERIRGWSEGPDYAPHPVRRIELAVDDVDL